MSSCFSSFERLGCFIPSVWATSCWLLPVSCRTSLRSNSPSNSLVRRAAFDRVFFVVVRLTRSSNDLAICLFFLLLLLQFRQVCVEQVISFGDQLLVEPFLTDARFVAGNQQYYDTCNNAAFSSYYSLLLAAILAIALTSAAVNVEKFSHTPATTASCSTSNSCGGAGNSTFASPSATNPAFIVESKERP